MTEILKTDLSALDDMIYSGRGIIIGMTTEGNPFIGYSLTGRSSSSQARELKIGENPKTHVTSNTIRTNVTDKYQLEQGSPALLLYPALTHVDDFLIVSNGAQTELLYSEIKNRLSHSNTSFSGLKNFLGYTSRNGWRLFNEPVFRYDQKDDKWIDITTYEPDSPNNTPRINGLVRRNEGLLHIIFADETLNRHEECFPVSLEPGKGYLLTTYNGENENPLKPFKGEPREISIVEKTPLDVAEKIYAAIEGGEKPGENYRVASAVMMSTPSGIICKRVNRSEEKRLGL